MGPVYPSAMLLAGSRESPTSAVHLFDYMTTIVKIHRKGQMTLPTRLRALAGIADGDFVVAAFQRGRIVITPKPIIDRSKFPTADDEYTPAQRRAIDARLNRAAAEVKKGHVSPAFATIEDFAAAIKADARQLKDKTKRSPR
jgi:bifunctional DNA-binding transcriptional regulator/antitoxin component of YhaV-PrlF toxin-antitoxin module